MPRKTLNYLRQNTIALLALFVALGGSSYAAMSIPAHSVGTKQLRNGSVTSRKLAKHSVAAANLDPKSIAGHIAEWAQVGANGQVLASSPQGSVSMKDPSRGLFHVSWHRSIPSNCIAIANPTNVGPIAPLSADTVGLESSDRSTDVLVQTFDGTGANVPETVNVVVICP